MKPFDPSAFGPAIAPLVTRSSLPELGPGAPNQELRASLAALTPEGMFEHLADRSMALACISGLWLLHDFLDESHTISQDLSSPTGSYWHGIMHRREPDAGNSKYWWRLVGEHPVIEMLKVEAPRLGYKFTNPPDFVDSCERVRGSGSVEEDLAKQIQLLEWQLLFDWCWNKAKSV
jgi:hypothetical protein